MSDHALFYRSVDGDRKYRADDFSDWLKKFFTNGVFTGDLFVAATEGMVVSVGTGYVNINGKVMIYEASTSLTLEPANGIYPRIDTIVVERNDTDRDFHLKVVTGEYTSLTDPQPTAPVRTSIVHQLVLAQIRVNAGVTSIIQANITDTRADSTLCGIVTGTVEEMDFSQFAAQFASYYTTFQNTYEADFTAWSQQKELEFSQWSAAQQALFAAWMAGEKSDFDDWFANLVYVLDGDVAGHLQNEIDAIVAGMSGSVFKIHTTNVSLYGKNVTATGATQTKTATFDANGDAEINGMTDVGTVTFTATDGIQTATTVMTIPYFGNYPVAMAFWAATVNITTDSPELYGKTITVRKGGGIIGSTSFNSEGVATYVASSSGTYTFSCVAESETVTATEEVTTAGETYNVSMHLFTATINLSTTTLQGETIDVTATGVSTTVTFDSQGAAQFIAHKAAEYTFSYTDEGQTYSTNVNVTTETTYSATLNSFEATLNITCDTSILNNSTITIKKDGVTVGTTTMTNAAATFVVNETGSYTASGTYSGTTFTSSAVSVTQSTSYSVQIKCIPTGSSVTPVNDIQTWLHCANIWNKNYTAISQVLADTSTLNSLIQSNNAADYMARSTDWASSVAANQTAMTYIGANNYCARKLLADATWASAIGNSTYFENVLNVKVPTMTSNTAPSGEAFAVRLSGNANVSPTYLQPYLAFDKGPTSSESNGWEAFGGGSTHATVAIGYKFTSAVRVTKIWWRNGRLTRGNPTYLTIQGSNDGNTWTNIHTINNLPNTPELQTYATFANNTAYTRYRFVTDTTTWLYDGDGNYYQYALCMEAQFWGHA